MTDEHTPARVIYIGPARRTATGLTRWLVSTEPARDWRLRLATEMDDACQEMARRGLRLTQVIPALSTAAFQGTWTEGAWMVFGPSDLGPSSPAV